jgi:hypothetical protein
MKRNSLVYFFLLMCLTPIMAQTIEYADEESSTEARLRVGANFQYNPVKGLSLSLEEEARMRNNFCTFDRLYSTFDISYKVNSYFKFGGTYSFIVLYQDGRKKTDYVPYWDLRHRAVAYATGSISFNRFTLSLRERFQATFRTDSLYNENEVVNPKMYLRTRLKLEYDFFSKPLKPYLSVEMFNPLNQTKYTNQWIDEMQYRLGLEWRLDAFNTLEFFYMFDHSFGNDVDVKSKKDKVIITPETEYNHIIGVFYSIRF